MVFWDARRVKNDVKDATELAKRLWHEDLPEAWVAPPEVRELRELVRYRAKLVALRTSAKAQVHAVMAKCGILPGLDDMFGPGGQVLLDKMELPEPYRYRVDSLRRLIEVFDDEVDMAESQVHKRLKGHRGYRAVQALHGVGPVGAAIFVAEIGDITRFADARHLCSWAGLTPTTANQTTSPIVATSPNRARPWCAGPRSKPSCATTEGHPSPPRSCAYRLAGARPSPGWRRHGDC